MRMGQRVATIYPEDALEGRDDLDTIIPDPSTTLAGVFRERVLRGPGCIACTEFDGKDWIDYSWRDLATEVSRWQTAFDTSGLVQGDRVAVCMRNGRRWVIFDQAALGLGLVVVPLYVSDRAENCNYILSHSGARLLYVENAADWDTIRDDHDPAGSPVRIILVEEGASTDDRVRVVSDWLPSATDGSLQERCVPGDLASIVYTSGTTGRPKGVMLSHRNMVMNAYSCIRSVAVSPRDVLLSILPLSHTLERTVGYYAPMLAGARIAYNRSIPQLLEDLSIIRPTGLISVPRVFERAYARINARLADGAAWSRRLFRFTVDTGWLRFQYKQGRGAWRPRLLLWPVLDVLVAKVVRARFGGRLQIVIVGGAPLPFPVARCFVSLGVNLLQGYGLTESSPTISTNTHGHNRPETIGLPLRDVEVKIGENDELLTRGPSVMMGYWGDEDATREAIDDEGWLCSGDQARIRHDGFIIITGRIKDILVLANGEKVAPADMEFAIAEDPLFEQIIVIGEQLPYLVALVVLERTVWRSVARGMRVDPEDPAVLETRDVEADLLERVRQHTRQFPAYAAIRRLGATLDPWTVENGLLTPTLKIRRAKVIEQHRAIVDRLYSGHDTYRVGSRQGTP